MSFDYEISIWTIIFAILFAGTFVFCLIALLAYKKVNDDNGFLMRLIYDLANGTIDIKTMGEELAERKFGQTKKENSSAIIVDVEKGDSEEWAEVINDRSND